MIHYLKLIKNIKYIFSWSTIRRANLQSSAQHQQSQAQPQTPLHHYHNQQQLSTQSPPNLTSSTSICSPSPQLHLSQLNNSTNCCYCISTQNASSPAPTYSSSLSSSSLAINNHSTTAIHQQNESNTSSTSSLSFSPMISSVKTLTSSNNNNPSQASNVFESRNSENTSPLSNSSFQGRLTFLSSNFKLPLNQTSLKEID